MSTTIPVRLPEMLHGADYNYEQSCDQPDILDADFELMQTERVRPDSGTEGGERVGHDRPSARERHQRNRDEGGKAAR
jgi:hypothetical protein